MTFYVLNSIHPFHFFLSCRAFETQMTRMEADFVEREAPPSYGQLIAQGLIPPVEDFPVYNPAQVVSHTHEHTLVIYNDVQLDQASVCPCVANWLLYTIKKSFTK